MDGYRLPLGLACQSEINIIYSLANKTKILTLEKQSDSNKNYKEIIKKE
jgi:hypothetical protein